MTCYSLYHYQPFNVPASPAAWKVEPQRIMQWEAQSQLTPPRDPLQQQQQLLALLLLLPLRLLQPQHSTSPTSTSTSLSMFQFYYSNSNLHP